MTDISLSNVETRTFTPHTNGFKIDSNLGIGKNPSASNRLEIDGSVNITGIFTENGTDILSVTGNVNSANYGSYFNSMGTNLTQIGGDGIWGFYKGDTHHMLRMCKNAARHYHTGTGDEMFLGSYGHVVIKSVLPAGGVKIVTGGRNETWNFTGSHRCLSEDKTIYNESNIGKIVFSTGNYISSSCEYGRYIIKPQEAEPIVSITNIQKDKRVLGVISSFEEKNSTNRQVDNIVQEPIISGDRRIVVNSLGEGAIFVCNKNGNFSNGDYIVSSDINGYGEKQDDDILHNYTVAKITMDCDFIEKTVSAIEYKYDYSNETKINILDEETQTLIWDNVYDENSNIVLEPDYKIVYINSSGDELTKQVWDELTEPKYIGAFVGCTYHCG